MEADCREPRAEVRGNAVAVALERRVQIRELGSARLTDQRSVGGEGKNGIKETS